MILLAHVIRLMKYNVAYRIKINLSKEVFYKVDDEVYMETLKNVNGLNIVRDQLHELVI